MKFHNKLFFKKVRKDLRKNQTNAEKILWKYIRNRKTGFKFKRQHSIGNFIVDFYCAEKRLIIELDGEIYTQYIENIEKDNARDLYLLELNYITLRTSIFKY